MKLLCSLLFIDLKKKLMKTFIKCFKKTELFKTIKVRSDWKRNEKLILCKWKIIISKNKSKFRKNVENSQVDKDLVKGFHLKNCWKIM